MGGGGSTYDYGFRIYNPQIARFLSVDPLSPKYPWFTPYQFAGNMPINSIDLDGLENKESISTGFGIGIPLRKISFKEIFKSIKLVFWVSVEQSNEIKGIKESITVSAKSNVVEGKDKVLEFKGSMEKDIPPAAATPPPPPDGSGDEDDGTDATPSVGGEGTLQITKAGVSVDASAGVTGGTNGPGNMPLSTADKVAQVVENGKTAETPGSSDPPAGSSDPTALTTVAPSSHSIALDNQLLGTESGSLSTAEKANVTSGQFENANEFIKKAQENSKAPKRSMLQN